MEKTGFVFINLLPYREKIKAQKLREFGFLMVLFLVAAGASIFAAHTVLSLKVESQESRNKFLETENKRLDESIKSISGLREEIKNTLAKRKVVEDLQTNRSDGVNIMNEVAMQLPEGSFVKSIKRVKDKITIVGQTTSNTKVSNYMTNLERTNVFNNPELVEIKAITVSSGKKTQGGKPIADEVKANEFTISVMVQRGEDEKLKLKDSVKEKEKPSQGKDSKEKTNLSKG